jgi:hypothetical protein
MTRNKNQEKALDFFIKFNWTLFSGHKWSCCFLDNLSSDDSEGIIVKKL